MKSVLTCRNTRLQWQVQFLVIGGRPFYRSDRVSRWDCCWQGAEWVEEEYKINYKVADIPQKHRTSLNDKDIQESRPPLSAWAGLTLRRTRQSAKAQHRLRSQPTEVKNQDKVWIKGPTKYQMIYKCISKSHQGLWWWKSNWNIGNVFIQMAEHVFDDMHPTNNLLNVSLSLKLRRHIKFRICGTYL